MQGKASKEASSNGSAKENACKHRVHTGKQSMQKERKEKRRRKEAGEREREKTRERDRENKKKEKEKEGRQTEWPRISRLSCRWDRKALASMLAPAQTSICGSLVKEGRAARASAGTILPT